MKRNKPRPMGRSNEPQWTSVRADTIKVGDRVQGHGIVEEVRLNGDQMKLTFSETLWFGPSRAYHNVVRGRSDRS